MTIWRGRQRMAGVAGRMGVVAAALGLAAVVATAAWVSAGRDRPSRATLALGQELYAMHCASCHGADLEGQPDWKLPLPSGRLPAPPHDASGHSWHHPDSLLHRIVKEGTAAVVGGGYETDMAGFGDQLDDAQIDAILSYIKSTWPRRERDHQRALSRAENR